MQVHQVHNPNPNKDSKGRFATAPSQPAKEKQLRGKHLGKFGKRMKSPDKVETAYEYSNSALGSSLGHSYSICRFGSMGRDQGID